MQLVKVLPITYSDNYRFAEGGIFMEELKGKLPTYEGRIIDAREGFSGLRNSIVFNEMIPNPADELYAQVRKKVDDPMGVENAIRIWAETNGLEVKTEEKQWD